MTGNLAGQNSRQAYELSQEQMFPTAPHALKAVKASMQHALLRRALCSHLSLSATLQAFPNGALAYFNCGEEAGASQPHKHTQIVPLPLAEGSSSTCTPFDSILQEAHSQSGALEMQSFPVRSLPYESYAAVLSARYAARCRCHLHAFCPPFRRPFHRHEERGVLLPQCI